MERPILTHFTLQQQTKDKSKATQFYTSARQHGKDHKQPNCIKEADRALKRIEFGVLRDEENINQ